MLKVPKYTKNTFQSYLKCVNKLKPPTYVKVSTAALVYITEAGELSVAFHNVFAASEKERYAPQSAKTYYSVYNAAYKRFLPAENPGNYIKIENTDATPVYTAYNKQ